MHNQEFEASPLMTVWSSWSDYMRRVVDLNLALHQGLHSVLPVARIAEQVILKDPPDNARDILDLLKKPEAHAQKEIDSDFEFVHAMILMAAWGAFEAYVEDVCKAVLAMEPHHLAGRSFKNVKLTPGILLVPDNATRMEMVFVETVSKMGTDLKLGMGRFESPLKLVGMHSHGDLTEDLKKAILLAGQVRNVWAHRAGKADAAFIEKSGNHFALNVGETVSISTPNNNEFIGAIATYGWLIINRFRFRHGMSSMWPVEDAPTHFALAYVARWTEIQKSTGPLADTTLWP